MAEIVIQETRQFACEFQLDIICGCLSLQNLSVLDGVTRPDGIPANLQGIWNPHMRPPWSSNYTTNINVEMNYWPAEVANLSEMHEPLLFFIGRLAKTGKITAKTFFNCRGWADLPPVIVPPPELES